MALDRTPSALQDEIRAWQEIAAPHIKGLDKEELRACGKAYANSRDDAEVADDPENFRQAWLRSFLAEVGSGTPQVMIEADALEWPESRAYVLEQATNQRARQAKLLPFVRRTAVDYGFRSARAVCYMGRERGSSILQPMVRRLAFDEYGSDATVTAREDARWEGHRVARDIEAVIAEAQDDKSLGWNLPLLRKIKDSLGRDPRRKDTSAVKRHELVYWCMWEPDYQVDKKRGEAQGCYGTVHYVVDPQIGVAMGPDRAQQLRKSEPWFGHPHGPYAFASGMKIGDLPIELSPLVAGASQGAWLNDVARSLRQAIQSYKLNTVVTNDTLSALMQNARNGDTITTGSGQDVRAMVHAVASGGATDQMLMALQQAMESAQRALGTYSNLGDVEAGATATAINAASVGYASTMHLHTSEYLSFLSQVMGRWAYWIACSPDVRMMVGPVAPEMATQLGIKPGAPPFIETSGEPSKAKDFRALNLRTDAYSVRQKDPNAMQQDMAALMMFVGWLAELGPMNAAVDVNKAVRLFARSRGVRDFERVVDANAIYAIAQKMLQAEEVPAPKGTSQPNQSLSFATPKAASAPTSMGQSMKTPKAPTAPASGPKRLVS